MRIRQQLRLYAASSGAGIVPPRQPLVEPQVCQLNRSPWDVVDFVFESHLRELKEEKEEEKSEEREENELRVNVPSAPEKHPVAVKEEQNEICNDHREEIKISPLKREREKDEEADKYEKSVKKRRDNTTDQTPQKAGETIRCRRSGSRGWKCWREAKLGHSFCEHHLSLTHNRSALREYSDPVAGSADRRTRERKPPPLPSSVVDFYFYSGFGPRWRKRRGTQLAETPAPLPATTTTTGAATTRSRDEGEEESVDCEKKKKKKKKATTTGRKAMKARSLKTLL
ncbi:hypothetical protein H6P81_017291 [Aristolochia fimbriata]|uniref:WRC domain-containing protein n=1 Tax=Aristolochia fimbriata TaxID=158543 RepID=A0AAV7E0R2_ARIFI|nr:hypothetical protein H6P81_017291 [Aristolochia fimbriata]